MHPAAFSLTCFLIIAMAFIAKNITALFENTTDYYDYDYNGTIDYDAFTPLPRGNFSEEIGEGEDYCDIPGLTTGEGKIPVGCTVTCLSGNQTYLKDGTLCVQCTVERATAMESYTNFTCPLGECCQGVCESCNRTTWCWKHNIMSMPPPN
uniref:Evasin n=1 Tax=Amblyomma aureolatum TaxID=187763 RepID=A0A1E1WWL6_9ACAR